MSQADSEETHSVGFNGECVSSSANELTKRDRLETQDVCSDGWCEVKGGGIGEGKRGLWARKEEKQRREKVGRTGFKEGWRYGWRKGVMEEVRTHGGR